MDSTVAVAAIAAVGIVASSVIGPAVMNMLTARHAREDRAEDYARQDLVAEKAATASRKLLEAAHQTSQSLEATTEKVQEVHKIVNQQRTDMTNYQEALKRALSAAGIEIPIDQSLPTPSTEADERLLKPGERP
jgi:hypothetical protein